MKSYGRTLVSKLAVLAQKWLKIHAWKKVDFWVFANQMPANALLLPTEHSEDSVSHVCKILKKLKKWSGCWELNKSEHEYEHLPNTGVTPHKEGDGAF